MRRGVASEERIVAGESDHFHDRCLLDRESRWRWVWFTRCQSWCRVFSAMEFGLPLPSTLLGDFYNEPCGQRGSPMTAVFAQ
jgi:hypothetical protein